MKSPRKDLERIKTLHELARVAIAEKRFQAAEEALNEALTLDENHAPSYELMGELLEAQEKPQQAETWRERGRETRKQAWQRQVEAEARGQHEMLGEPGRHEIP